MEDHEVAIAVAEAGAAVVRSGFGSALERLHKGRGDFATNVDVEAERAMVALLRRERPEDGILAEESGRSGTGRSRLWLIDPLCGTLNYAARMRVAAVNVALRIEDGFGAAAVADPFNEETLWADGAAAFARRHGRDARLRPTAASRLVDLNFDPPFPNGSVFKAVALAADSEFEASFRPRVLSSTIALAWVATGQRAGYVTDGDVRDSVHFAAGIAVCEAAGCVVTDLLGRPWGSGDAGILAAADSDTHTALLNQVRKCWGSP